MNNKEPESELGRMIAQIAKVVTHNGGLSLERPFIDGMYIGFELHRQQPEVALVIETLIEDLTPLNRNDRQNFINALLQATDKDEV